jgi:hypothetical protein
LLNDRSFKGATHPEGMQLLATERQRTNGGAGRSLGRRREAADKSDCATLHWVAQSNFCARRCQPASPVTDSCGKRTAGCRSVNAPTGGPSRTGRAYSQAGTDKYDRGQGRSLSRSQAARRWSGRRSRGRRCQEAHRVRRRAAYRQKSGRWDSNPQHPAWKAGTLAIELRPRQR